MLHPNMFACAWVELLRLFAAAAAAAAAAALGDEHALPPSSAVAVAEADTTEPSPHPFDAVVDNRYDALL